MKLPLYRPLEERFPNWKTARAIFEACPVQDLTFFYCEVRRGLCVDFRWAEKLFSLVPREDVPEFETICEEAAPLAVEFCERLNVQGYFGRNISELVIAEMNSHAAMLDRSIIAHNVEPTWKEALNHLFGVQASRFSPLTGKMFFSSFDTTVFEKAMKGTS